MKGIVSAGVLSVLVLASAPAQDPDVQAGNVPPRVAYLGISTSEVDPALAGHLRLAPGFGLLVRYVDPASPAQGRLEVDDILVRLDDQHLVNHAQLAALVRSREPGAGVELHVVRRGQVETVSVELAGKVAPPPPPPEAYPWAVPPVGGGGWPGRAPGAWRGAPDWEDRVEELLRGEPTEGGLRERLLELLGEDRGRGADRSAVPEARIESSSVTTTLMEDGTKVTIRDENGKRRFRVETDGGRTVVEGDLDAEADRATVPEAQRPLLEKVEKMQKRMPRKGVQGALY